MFFHRIVLEAFVHATEEEERVKEALFSLVPFKAEEEHIERQEIEGSFENPLIILRLKFERQQEIKAIIKRIKEMAGEKEFDAFDLEEHVSEDDDFWMRFDKGELYCGRLALGGRDVVQLKGKVAAFPAKRKIAIGLMRDLWS